MRTRSGATLNDIDLSKRSSNAVPNPPPNIRKPTQPKRLKKGVTSNVVVTHEIPSGQETGIVSPASHAPAPAELFDSQGPNNETSLPPSSLIPESLTPSNQPEAQEKKTNATSNPNDLWETFSSDGEEFEGNDRYVPFADDPFGFAAAERKLKHRREALGLVPTFEDDFTSQDRGDYEGDYEPRSEGPESPWKGHRRKSSRSNRSLRYSSLNSDALDRDDNRLTAATRKTEVRHSEQPKVMKTHDLERLLPRKGPAKGRVKRLGVKRQDAKENKDARGRTTLSKKKTKIVDPEISEGEVIDSDRLILKVRLQRSSVAISHIPLKINGEQKRNLFGVENYSLETETVIWL